MGAVPDALPGPAPRAGYLPVPTGVTAPANRSFWDGDAGRYVEEHGAFLGAGADGDLVWGPEGLRESEAALLGDVHGRRVLDVGCGGAQSTRWLAAHGARVVGVDLSIGMLRSGAGRPVPLVQADASRLPFAAAAFDLACSAYGAVPFVEDPGAVMREVARVLRPGGRWVFSLTHPVRWAFPDDPGEHGLTATRSYFDRTPYRETGADGRVTYVEHHRTLGDRVRDLVAAGFVLEDVVEPQWPAGHEQVWGGWSPLRGRLLPGTVVFVARLHTA